MLCAAVQRRFMLHAYQCARPSRDSTRGAPIHSPPPPQKLVVNISTGQSGDRLTYAARVLEQLTGQKPLLGRARYTVRQFSIRRNETISAYVTVRGEKAMDILERGLKVRPRTATGLPRAGTRPCCPLCSSNPRRCGHCRRRHDAPQRFAIPPRSRHANSSLSFPRLACR